MRTYRFRVEWLESAENDEVARCILDEMIGEIKDYALKEVEIVASDVQILPRKAGDARDEHRFVESEPKGSSLVPAVDDDTGEPIIGELERAYSDDAKKEWEDQE